MMYDLYVAARFNGSCSYIAAVEVWFARTQRHMVSSEDGNANFAKIVFKPLSHDAIVTAPLSLELMIPMCKCILLNKILVGKIEMCARQNKLPM
jgi:hypothetical protein